MMGMSKEPDDRTDDEPDEGEYELTGDPLVDRGMNLDVEDFEAAVDDPDHPDHEAAKAAEAHMAQRFGSLGAGAVSESMRRIAENFVSAASFDLKNLHLTGEGQPFIPDSTARVAALDLHDIGTNGTPQQTLKAIMEVAERMSEAVRVAAEHRDVAIHQVHLAEREAVAARKSERRMLRLTWAAVIGTWAALIGTWVAVAR